MNVEDFKAEVSGEASALYCTILDLTRGTTTLPSELLKHAIDQLNAFLDKELEMEEPTEQDLIDMKADADLKDMLESGPGQDIYISEMENGDDK